MSLEHRHANAPTLVDLCREAADDRATSGYTFLVDDGIPSSTLTFARLDTRARAIASALGSGAQGARVLLPHLAGLDFVEAYFGCLYAGAIAVPLPPLQNRRAGDARLRSVAGHCAAEYLLCTGREHESVNRVVGGDPALGGVRVVVQEDVPDSAGDGWAAPVVREDSVAHLQYSSGSTGAPKAVELTHSVARAQLSYYAGLVECRPDSGVVSWLPNFHDFGLITGVLLPLYAGTDSWLMDPLAFVRQPLRWLSAISRHRAELTASPNFGYDLCLRSVSPEARDGLDLGCLRAALNGAEPVRAATVRAFVEAFAPHGLRAEALCPAYGLAEATLVVTATPLHERPTSVSADVGELLAGRYRPAAGGGNSRSLMASGSTAPPSEVVVADPATLVPREPGSVGEVLVRGPGVATGYWNDPRRTEEVFRARVPGRDGVFLRTGDLGFLLDGRLFITGRIKDVVNVDGQNHYPQDIEWTAENSHPAVRAERSIAFSVDDGHRELLVVVVEPDRRHLQAHPGTSDESIRDAVRRAVAEEHGITVHEVVVLHSSRLPLTSSGKRRRLQCREDFVAGALS